MSRVAEKATGYGTGANSKSVILTTIARILGGYHRAAPIETFTETAAKASD